jgi:hypothetical protein
MKIKYILGRKKSTNKYYKKRILFKVLVLLIIYEKNT